jgi:hypothetical protein
VTKAGRAAAPTVVKRFLLCLITGFALLGCGSGSHSDTSIEWGVFKQLGPRTVKLVAQVDYCIGAPVPRIGSVKKEYAGHQVLVGLSLAAPPDTYQTDKCRGVVRPVYKTMKFNRDLTALELFDTSTSPPQLRWPS